ncbi:Beta-galactosidase 7 [Dissostichus eleginoides]|uniref:Beta-galactosidase 7 n=1 Tax=Dissostichus eleginoides TaxID=100907 RepID=A0AAD9BDX6_DISEL|nr:Beta-galactosidase 7 [Dissostichus eleginoides]
MPALTSDFKTQEDHGKPDPSEKDGLRRTAIQTTVIHTIIIRDHHHGCCPTSNLQTPIVGVRAAAFSNPKRYGVVNLTDFPG